MRTLKELEELRYPVSFEPSLAGFLGNANKDMNELDEVLAVERLSARMALTGPQVGEFVRFASGEVRRICHVWAWGDPTDHVQTIETWEGSYYLSDGGGSSYSGGLDGGPKLTNLTLASDFKDGAFWFFHNNYHTAGNGVAFLTPCRIWNTTEVWNDKRSVSEEVDLAKNR